MDEDGSKPAGNAPGNYGDDSQQALSDPPTPPSEIIDSPTESRQEQGSAVIPRPVVEVRKVERLVDSMEAVKKHPWGKLIVTSIAGLAALFGIATGMAWLVGAMNPAPPPATATQQATSVPVVTEPSPVTTSPVAVPSPTPKETLEGFPVNTNGHVCPIPNPSDFRLPDVEICVVMWCQVRSYELNGQPQMDQTQFKMKVKVENNSSSIRDISISNPSAMRLLVSQRGLPESWRPPRKTDAANDQPVLVEWSGSGSKQYYWALPPNVYADSDPTQSGVVTGFYTHWDPPILGPGESFYRPKPDDLDPRFSEGNLVFQVPLDAVVYGLAIVDKTNPEQVIGVTPYGDWKDRMVSPGSF